MTMVGYKVILETFEGELQVGLVAESLAHLKKQVQETFRSHVPLHVFLEDGTLVCDEDYFQLLEPQTKLRVKPGSLFGKRQQNTSPANVPGTHFIPLSSVGHHSSMQRHRPNHYQPVPSQRHPNHYQPVPNHYQPIPNQHYHLIYQHPRPPALTQQPPPPPFGYYIRPHQHSSNMGTHYFPKSVPPPALQALQKFPPKLIRTAPPETLCIGPTDHTPIVAPGPSSHTRPSTGTRTPPPPQLIETLATAPRMSSRKEQSVPITPSAMHSAELQSRLELSNQDCNIIQTQTQTQTPTLYSINRVIAQKITPPGINRPPSNLLEQPGGFFCTKAPPPQMLSIDEGYSSVTTTPSPLSAEASAILESNKESVTASPKSQSNKFSRLIDFLTNEPLSDILHAYSPIEADLGASESCVGIPHPDHSVEECPKAALPPDDSPDHAVAIVEDHSNLCGNSSEKPDDDSLEVVNCTSGSVQKQLVVEKSPKPLESLCVTVPVYVKDGCIIATERMVIDCCPPSPPTIADSELTNEVSAACVETSSKEPEIFECAYEEVVCTTSSHCTVTHVHKVLANLRSLAHIHSATAPMVDEYVDILVSSEDPDTDSEDPDTDYVSMDFDMVQDMLVDSSIDDDAALLMEVGQEVSIRIEPERISESDYVAELLLLDNEDTDATVPIVTSGQCEECQCL